MEIRLKKAASNAHWPSLEASPADESSAAAGTAGEGQMSAEPAAEFRPSYPTSKRYALVLSPATAFSQELSIFFI